jgi:hypothetical protein
MPTMILDINMDFKAVERKDVNCTELAQERIQCHEHSHLKKQDIFSLDKTIELFKVDKDMDWLLREIKCQVVKSFSSVVGLNY